jgi:hypothetical protein
VDLRVGVREPELSLVIRRFGTVTVVVKPKENSKRYQSIQKDEST